MTPVLLFKSENYSRYQELGEAQQRAERDRLLVSNLLMALRGLECEFSIDYMRRLHNYVPGHAITRIKNFWVSVVSFYAMRFYLMDWESWSCSQSRVWLDNGDLI